MLKIIAETPEIPFDFEKWIRRIVSIVPPNDITGISAIKLVDKFSDKRCQREAFACYLPGYRGRSCFIELNKTNIISKKVPLYLLEDYPEIASLYLSHFVYHEIGHHAHYYKRHGVNKVEMENFATLYDVAGYYNYYISRKYRILISFFLASINSASFDKTERKKIRKEMKEFFLWPYRNNSMPFP